jgi:pimeloyl-ACP methyl ester carboxylesterase
MSWSDAAAGWLDAAIVSTRRLRGAPDLRIEAMQQQERLERLLALRPTYDRDELLAFPGGFLRPGPLPEPELASVLTPHGPAQDLGWSSLYEPWSAELPDGIPGHYAPASPNARAWARRYLAGAKPGPAVVAVHGYGAGMLAVEPFLWPVRAWRRQGLDVVLPILPFHGRRSVQRGAPIFPGADPRLTHEGFRQAVHDLTALIAWLRSEGHGPIGLVGMSMGGYTSALLATLLPELAYVVLVIPLSSIADVARAHGRLGEGEGAEALHAALEAIYRPSSPFARPSQLPPDRMRVVAARGDRITGVAQAERLAGHFQAPLTVVRGSHTLQYGLPWGEITSFVLERSR